uniref:Scavenger receptor class F member 2 n=1 Tax=Magallana gigas TaxID=29159 RepID=K1QUK5_MAGGI
MTWETQEMTGKKQGILIRTGDRAFLNASNAVDGLKTDLSFAGRQCTQSENFVYEAEWRVDLGAVLGIHHITIYYRTDNVKWGPNHGYVGRFLGFSVYVSNTTIKEDGDQCFQDNQIYTKDTIPAVLTLNCTHHGRYVIYYNKRTLSSNPPDYSQFAYNELCEFEVYECRNKKHGAGCSENCGHCLNGEQCNHVNGTCHNGCEAGYYKPRCKKACDPEEDCICLQGRCIEHRTYEKMTSNETVDSSGLSTYLSVVCLALETVHTKNMPLHIELTERQKHHMQVMKKYYYKSKES